MKLLELIGKLIDLHKANGNIDVVLQADEEGNYYESLSGAGLTYYDGENTFDTKEDAEESGARPVVVVYP